MTVAERFNLTLLVVVVVYAAILLVAHTVFGTEPHPDRQPNPRCECGR